MSRGQSAEKSLLETFIKPASSFQPASVLSNHDVGTFSSKQYLSDEQKYQLLRNHFIPKKTYEFPAIKYGGRNRTFQCSWLERCTGLVYSPSLNGCFCIYCFLFGSEDLGGLSSKPLLDMAHAHDRLTNILGKMERTKKITRICQGKSF